MPVGAAALGVVGIVVALQGLTRSFADFALPPRALSWYQDDMWNLGNVSELMRAVSPQVAQVAGRPFEYHWFSDAHLAAMSLTTGLDPVLVVARFWAVPFLVLVVGVAMAVGHRVSGSAWVGAGAGFLFAVSPSIEVSWFAPTGFSPNVIRSPSLIFALPLMLLGIDLVVAVLRGSRQVRVWVLLGFVLVACAGAKSSVLPVLGGGVVLAALLSLLVSRRRLVPLIGVAALMGAVVVLTRTRLAGGENGSGLQLFATFTSAAPWQLVQGRRTGTLGTGLVIPGLGAPGAVRVLVLILAVYLVSYLWALVGAPTFARTDLAGWFLFGIGLAGVVGLLTIRHPAYSQIYFLRTAVMAWHLLALWGYRVTLGRSVEHTGARRTAWCALAGAVAGVALLDLSQQLGGATPTVPPVEAVAFSLQRSLIVPAAVVALTLVCLLLRRRAGTAARSLAAVGLTSAVLSAALVTSCRLVLPRFGVGLTVGAVVLVVVGALLATIAHRAKAASIGLATVATLVCVGLVAVQSVDARRDRVVAMTESRLVTDDEVAATRWVAAAAGPFDVVATNVHCLPTRTTPKCDARAFWVSGLTGRRVLVEGWGYTDAAQSAHGRNGLSYSRQPFDDPALLALNDGIFTEPTPAAARALRDRGVRWLLADGRAGAISPDIAQVAAPVFRSGPVSVYRLT